MTVAPGTLLGGYRIEAVAGRGGMGVVYRAVQEALERGAQLDRAEEYLDERGVEHETDGGGTFGVVVSENWTVCETAPSGGDPLADPSVTLVISRSC